jgi:PAS domain S-box-containing protein
VAGVSLSFESLFTAVPSALLLLDLELAVVDANPAFCALLGRRRTDLRGRRLFDLFPDNPDDPAADGAQAVRASLEAARDTGSVQAMPLQRYDTSTAEGGVFARRYWSIVNAPIVDEHGETVLVLNRVEDVSAFVEHHSAASAPGTKVED